MGMTVLLVTERGEVLHEIGDPTSHFAPPLARRRGARLRVAELRRLVR